jgi:hypothetical protein
MGVWRDAATELSIAVDALADDGFQGFRKNSLPNAGVGIHRACVFFRGLASESSGSRAIGLIASSMHGGCLLMEFLSLDRGFADRTMHDLNACVAPFFADGCAAGQPLVRWSLVCQS